MKRINNVYSSICEIDNLYLAYYKASKGKKLKPDVIEFSDNLDANINDIREQLVAEKVNIGNYHYFSIKDPKERLICAASFSERVIHHAIINVTDSYFDRFQIFDTYACRKNKGMHRAVKKAFTICKKYTYFMKLDIRKYFDSVDHNVLYTLLQRKFKDKSLLNLLKNIIDSYQTDQGKGIPIGNLTSQYFANFYLGYLDRYIKEDLRLKDYVRYMDDFILFADDRVLIHTMVNKITTFLNDNLSLMLKSPIINKIENGFPFLGFKIYRNKLFLTKRSKDRFKNKLIYYENEYVNGTLSERDLTIKVNSLIAFTKLGNTRNLRNVIISKFGVIS